MNRAIAVESGADATYQRKLIALLGARDPFDVLERTPEIVARVLNHYAVDVLRRRPFPGKWTPTEIVGHLVDSEFVLGYRVRLVLCEERPTILGMDQDLWVAGQGYNDRDPFELAAMFAALRKCNLAQWRRIPADAYERLGVHNERGPESLGLMLRMEAGHDLSHIDQLTRYVAAAAKPA